MKLNDTVWIKEKNVAGVIVDVSYRCGTKYYIVESIVKGALPGHDGGEWPLFDCVGEDIEVIV